VYFQVPLLQVFHLLFQVQAVEELQVEVVVLEVVAEEVEEALPKKFVIIKTWLLFTLTDQKIL
jgi:hypothetical protein